MGDVEFHYYEDRKSSNSYENIEIDNLTKLDNQNKKEMYIRLKEMIKEEKLDNYINNFESYCKVK